MLCINCEKYQYGSCHIGVLNVVISKRRHLEIDKTYLLDCYKNVMKSFTSSAYHNACNTISSE